MGKKQCVAMILAGGRGERLGALTRYYSKPAVHFGANHRIIDFSLSNCRNSGIYTVGVVSQCSSTDLHTYISNWKTEHTGIHTLTPRNGEDPYCGTADAIYKNIEFIDRFHPESVLILAGDHVYKMDYGKMIDSHRKSDADLTVASIAVPISETSRFGIINAEKESGRVYGFEEKPRRPKSDLASMGVYVFKWNTLKKHLLADSKNEKSRHDFGHSILPEMLACGESIYTYRFNGYWRDVGTVDSLWEANMNQVNDPSLLHLDDEKWRIFSPYRSDTPNFVSRRAAVHQSILAGNCTIFGEVKHSVLSDSVTVSPGAKVVNSVVMPGAYIGENVKIYNAVIGIGTAIMDNTVIGADDGTKFFVDRKMCSKGVSLVAPWVHISENMRFRGNSQIDREQLKEYAGHRDEATELDLRQAEAAVRRKAVALLYPQLNAYDLSSGRRAYGG